MKKILSFIICLVLVVGIGVGAFFLLKPNQEASAVMTLQTNPEIQLVLDQNNKVISVNAVNNDGQSLIMNVNFVGKSAEEAAKLFAETATNFGKVDLNANAISSSNIVNITIACEDADSKKYTELQSKVKEKVNNYFKEIGVVAGAIVNVSEDIKSEISKLGVDISEYANKTYDEIIADIGNTYKELEGVALELRNGLLNQIDTLKTTFGNMFNLEDQIASLKTEINEIKQDIAAAKEELKNATTEFQKITINATIDTFEAGLETAEKSLKKFEKKYKELKKEYENKIDEFVKNFKEQSTQILNNIKTEINTAIEQGKTLVQNHINEFENLSENAKNNMINEIELFQNSLVA